MMMTRLACLVALISGCASSPDPDDRSRGATAEGKADGALGGSCALPDGDNTCGGPSTGSCHCDDRCADFHDCCVDAAAVCGVESNRLDDRTAGKTPLLGAGDLQIVASLPYPPGNVAVAANGRTFISFFEDGNKGDFKIAEIVNGQARAFPASLAFHDRLHAVLGVRADQHGRLWLLDHGQIGIHHAKLIAIDIATEAVVFEHQFSRTSAPFGSLLNDLVISPDGNILYISDLSPLAKRPAIVVVDLRGSTPIVSRRLEKHATVVNGRYDTFVNDVEFKIKGIRPTQGIDGIALDQDGTTLFYSPLNDGELYSVETAMLLTATDAALAQAVVHVADITMTDGMIADTLGRVYLTDMEHSAITRVDPATGELELVARDSRLRWPDGFAWAPDGSLYVSASALHTFLPKLIVTSSLIASNGPYHVFRLTPP